LFQFCYPLYLFEFNSLIYVLLTLRLTGRAYQRSVCEAVFIPCMFIF